ncbi:Hypothetical protein PHPALM_1374, partial [Phytophthora palmivora]
NFYTSSPLSHKLLGMGHSHVGTIRKDRKGWCLGIEFSQKRRPKRMPRGTYKMAENKTTTLIHLSHSDLKSARLTKVTRRERDGTLSEVPCPQLTIFLGLVDLAMVNAFIVHKIAMARAGKSVPTHAAFMRRLHMDLLNQTSEDFVGGDDMEGLVTEPLPRAAHMLEKTDEMNGAKRRQWLCKVCSAYAGPGDRRSRHRSRP